MQHTIIGRDPVLIDRCKQVQLQRSVQMDSHNCGVLCLKVSIFLPVYTLNQVHVCVFNSLYIDCRTTSKFE